VTVPIVYADPEFPPDLRCQAVAFRRAQWPWIDGDRLVDDRGAEGNDAVHVVVALRGVLIAHATVLPRAASVVGEQYGVGGATSVFTFPGFRGRGHGSAVVEAATRYITDRGVDVGMLSVDPGAGLESFYGRAGWEPVPAGRTLSGPPTRPTVAEEDPRLPALRMMVYLSERGRAARRVRFRAGIRRQGVLVAAGSASRGRTPTAGTAAPLLRETSPVHSLHLA